MLGKGRESGEEIWRDDFTYLGKASGALKTRKEGLREMIEGKQGKGTEEEYR